MKIFLIAAAIVIILCLAAGYIAFYIACARRENSKVRTPEQLAAASRSRQWCEEHAAENVSIVSRDGLELKGVYIHAENSRGTIIMLHGYRTDCFSDFSGVYEYCHSLGYSLLCVSQRAHGKSGGNYISFGIKERFDCLDWATYVADRFGPEYNIFLCGLSMGCTTVLMSSGLPLPGNVRGMIADCGFISPLDQFAHMFKTRYHLPLHPIVDLADIFARLLGGFSFREYSSLQAMEKCRIPALFIHGESDRFVPMEHTVRNFRACQSEKRLFTVPGAGHGRSYITAPEQYRAELKAFLDKYTL